MVIANKWTTRDIFALNIMIRRDPNILLESHLAHPSVLGMQCVVTGEIVSGNDPLDWVAKECNINGRLR